MTRFQLWVRVTALTLASTVVLGFFGGLFGGSLGFMAMSSLAVFLLIIFGTLSGSILINHYSPLAETPPGIERSLHWARIKAEQEGLAPTRAKMEIGVFEDPRPHVLVFRSFQPWAFSGGTTHLLLSKGALALFNEEELRAILQMALDRGTTRGLTFQTLCAVFMLGLLKIGPAPLVGILQANSDLGIKSTNGVSRAHLSPSQALGFLALYPLIRFISLLSELESQELQLGELFGESPSAMRKLSESLRVYPALDTTFPLCIYLFYPFARRLLENPLGQR